MARRDTSPRPVLRPEGFGVLEQTERMLQPEGDPVAPTEVLKTGITKEVMDKAQEYVSNPPPVTPQSPVQKAIDKSLIGGAEEDYEVKVSKVTPEGRGAIRGMISRVLGKEFDGDLDAFYYCTTFVSDMLDSIGADPLDDKGDEYNRTRANAYMKYGTPVDIEDIQEGDIVIFDFPKLPDGTLTLDPTRGKRNGLGDHATFYAGDRLDVNKPGSNYIGVLGGEQGGGAAISMKAFDKSHILGVRRIQYNDIDYEFTKELAKVNPDFNKFLNNQAKAFDFNAFQNQYSNPIQGSNRLTSGFDKGGLAESKGLSWGELIVDNILGLDNEYESFGEKLGKAINEDEIKFLKDAAIGVYEGTKEFVQAPVETTKQVVSEIKDSVTRLGSEDLNTRLQRMYGVSYEQATDEQVNQAREAVLGDALTALELVPAAKGATTVAKASIAAVPGGLKADVVGQTKAMLSGDREFLSGTPTPKADAQPVGAQVSGMFTPRKEPKPEVSSTDPTNTKTFEGLYGLSVEEGVPELANQDASFYSNLISDHERWQIGEDFSQLTFENNAAYGDEYNVMHNITGNAYTMYVEDLADQVKQEVGRIFKEKLQLIDAEQLLRLAALQRMHKQNGLQEGSSSAAEIMDLAEGIRRTLNLTNDIRVNGPEAYLGNKPFDAKVKALDENGAIVDKKVSDLKGEDGKYLLKDLIGLGSSNRLNERFESIILDIVNSDDFLTPNSKIYAGNTPQTFNSYVNYVIDTEDSFFNQTPYKGPDQTFRNINVEVLDEFLKKTSNKPVPLTGSRILSILQNDPRVNSKNIPKEIFEAEKDNVFDPSQAKELLELYSFQVKPKSQDNFSRFQRQINEGLAIGIPKDYNELTLNVDPDNAAPSIQPNRMHFDRETLAHTRYTVMEPDAPNLSDETRELLGDEDFILVEELQSDLLSGGYQTYKKLDFESLVNNRLGQASGPSGTTYMDDLKAEAGVLISRYFDDFKDFAIKKFDDKYNNGVDVNSREYIKKGDRLIDSLGDKQEEWLKKSYPNATEEQINTAVINFRSRARTFLYDMSDDEGKFHDTVLRRGSKTRGQAEINIEARKDPFYFGTPPIKKNIEGVELNLQNLISEASKLGINKIVIPPFEKIASARFFGEELDLALKNQVMDKDGNIKTGHRLYQTYVTDLEKALKKFEQSYPIKVNRDVDIPYQGQNRLSVLPELTYSDGLDLKMLKGIVIDISDMDKDFDLERPRFAEGGAVGNMNQQMSFAFEDGGLRDDGMMRDPVSGNEVPPGSTAKEVRDDIPAQLSEGEYVVPADVVRYYGVKFFEDLRDNAKMGLQDMEARGRIGGEPVPAGGPMDDDLSPEELAAIQEMMGMAEGGVVNMYKQQQDLYSPPNPAIGNPTTTGMAFGGEVRGYQPGGLTQQQQAEQGFYAAGQQAQNAGFVGFPLGSTIFPSAGTGTTFTSPTAGTTAFTPVNMINMQTGVRVTATTQADYDRYISEGYIVDDGTLQPKGQGSGGGGGGGPTPPPTEPYKDWLASADFNSAEGLEKFVAGIEYDPTKDKTMGQAFGATLMGGPMAGLATAAGSAARGGLSAISDLRAASLIAKAQGLDKLAAKYDKRVADIIEKGPGILDFLDDVFATGKQKANAWAKKNGHENIQAATEAGVTPKPPVIPPKPPATPGSGGDDQKTAAEILASMQANQDENDSTAVSDVQITRDGEKSNQKTMSTTYGTGETATTFSASEDTVDPNDPTGYTADVNKGGLMNKAATKKKVKRQYRKGGLANKK